MALFKQVPRSYLGRKIAEYWYNMTQNWDGPVHDDDFFGIVKRNVSQSRIVSLVQAAFTPKELEEMGDGRRRYSRLDLEDSPEDILMALWNHPEHADRVRLLMGAVKKVLLRAFRPARDRREDIESRLEELWNTFHLDEIECEVMLVSYLVSETCFCWPRRVENGEKPLFFAMAINRSYAEVQKALSPTGSLRKFNVLDCDFDFNGRVYGGFLTGADAEAFESRFYRKSEGETLPWSFYGDLAETDGAVLKKMFASVGGKLNVLLYGEPGTGKTSFARSLAAELGRTAYEIRQGEDNGRGNNADFRMAGIRVCNEQLDAEKSVVIVDEADELLRGGGMNFFDNLDPAILRRFTFKLQFGYLDEAGKKLFFERMFKTTLTDEEASELAAIRNLAPGDFRTVRQGLYYLGDGADNADRLSALREESSVKKEETASTPHIGFC